MSSIESTLMPAAFATAENNNATTSFVETGYASTAFVILCSALVMIMTPAVGLLYSGFSRSNHALTIIMICFLAYTVVTIQWVLFGFSLAFSEQGSPFIGTFEFAGLRNVHWQALSLTAGTLPAIALALYQLQFATVTVAIIFGSVVERIKILPSIIFMFVWTTVIYDPVAYWTWGARGWIKNMSCLSTTALDQEPCQIGGLDFAGGGPVHLASGAASLAFCIFLGHRKKQGNEEFKAHNITSIFMGTALLWMGWFGFNGGSQLAADSGAAYAGLVTTVAASSGALTWTLIDYLQTGKMSGISFCSGAIAGLVGITPSAGFVEAWASICIGVLTSLACSFSVKLKDRLGYDDSGDAWGLHGVGGFVGNILTAVFASQDGLVAGRGDLLAYNLLGSISIFGYSFVGTLLVLTMINYIPGLNFRMTDQEEREGDIAEMGEVAYSQVPERLAEMKKVNSHTSTII